MGARDFVEVVVNDGTAQPRIIEFGICGDVNIESGVLVDINSDGEIVKCPDLHGDETKSGAMPLGVALKDYSPGEVVSVVTGDGIVINAQVDGVYNSNHVGTDLGLMLLGNGRGRLGYVYDNLEKHRRLAVLLSATTAIIKTHKDDASHTGARYYARVLMV